MAARHSTSVNFAKEQMKKSLKDKNRSAVTGELYIDRADTIYIHKRAICAVYYVFHVLSFSVQFQHLRVSKVSLVLRNMSIGKNEKGHVWRMS